MQYFSDQVIMVIPDHCKPEADFLGGDGGAHLSTFSSTPSEKFENGVHTVGYYFYYKFYSKKLIYLAVRVH